ncbi:MAG: Fic family protein [Pseudomonadota bacterium]
MSDERESVPTTAPILIDPDEIAEKEAANAIEQYDRVLDLIDMCVRDGRPFRLRPSTILTLHKVATTGLLRLAGTFRNANVKISKSKHIPPDDAQVPGLVEDMCDWVNDRWNTTSALDLAAYVMWRLNWIHPFDDGNGRTTRAVSYLVMSVRAGHRLPGNPTIPEQIAAAKTPYYEALEAADTAEKAGQIDVGKMRDLLESYLAAQLVGAHEQAMSVSDAQDDRKFH